MCTRRFGNKYAAQNWGALYTAKGWGALFVPISGAIAARHGWNLVFLLLAGFSAVAAVLALILQSRRWRADPELPAPSLARVEVRQ